MDQRTGPTAHHAAAIRCCRMVHASCPAVSNKPPCHMHGPKDSGKHRYRHGHRPLYRHVYRHVYIGVCAHLCRHVYRHVCRHVSRHVCGRLSTRLPTRSSRPSPSPRHAIASLETYVLLHRSKQTRHCIAQTNVSLQRSSICVIAALKHMSHRIVQPYALLHRSKRTL